MRSLRSYIVTWLTTFFLLFSASSPAGIVVDNGSYTSVDGLDWLDFNLTSVSRFLSEELADNVGWRLASDEEAYEMMHVFVPCYVNGTQHRFVDQGTVNNFINLFGLSHTSPFASYASTTGGLLGVNRNNIAHANFLEGNFGVWITRFASIF